MGATLDALHRLQEVELQIADIRRDVDRKLRAARRQEQRIAEIEERIRSERSALQSSQMEADRFDLDVKSKDAEIVKLRQALQVSKTNKEYSAILTQLNTYKADMSKVEDRVLSLMSQVDVKRREIAAIEQERESERAKLAELQADAEAADARSRDRLAGLQAQRLEAASVVPPTALEFFDRVAKKNEGAALARVVRTHPKRAEYACEGCNMSITIEQVNAVLSRDEAIVCNICGRILYLEAPAASRAS